MKTMQTRHGTDPRIEGANLNLAETIGGGPVSRGHTQADPAAFVQAYCGDITPSLIEKIKQYDVVLSCCAWLTNAGVLEALAGRKHAMAIVQKEDFLRPDRGQVGDWKARLRAMYERLPGANQFSLAPAWSFGTTWGEKGDAVRCVGVVGDRSRVTPKMHHKFFVFCDLKTTCVEEGDGGYSYEVDQYIPCAVWTGSLNASSNAERSRENAVYIESRDIAEHYFAEFVEMLKISESLNWWRPWIDPGLREGT